MYAIPQASSRRHLWSALGQLELSDAWMMVGNFNCVLKGEERSLYKEVSSSFNGLNTRDSLMWAFLDHHLPGAMARL